MAMTAIFKNIRQGAIEMFGHCKDCRWWRSHRSSFSAKSVAVCDKLDGHAEKYTAVPEAEAEIYAEANDDQGLQVGLKTGPMFGCAMFDPIPTPSPV